MDELTIGDKKYISSKRAAKETGYAKDYVGQLCREGRVPARLVGRSWYVLESAIQDHRFKDEDKESEKTISDSSSSMKTWETPRYEAVSVEPLPSLAENGSKEIEEKKDVSEQASVGNLHEAWKEWFDRFDKGKMTASDVVPVKKEEHRAETIEEPSPVKSSTQIEEDAETKIPLHVMSRYYPPKELLPEREQDRERVPARPVPVRQESGVGPKTKIVTNIGFNVGPGWILGGVVLAIFLLAMTIVNSGFLDDAFVASGTTGSMTGISVFNR